jgi:transposase
MGAPKKADWREERRKRAWAMKQAGWPQKEIAQALGVSEGAVSQWLKRAREGGGVEALARRPSPGMTPRLSAEQRAQLPALLAREPKPTGSAAMSERRGGWYSSSPTHSGYATTATTSVGCCASWAGAGNGR